MKLFNKIAIALAALATFTVKADIGFDAFSALRTVNFSPMQNVTAVTGVTSNVPVDMVKFNGTAILIFNAYTNAGGTPGTLTATLNGSSDTTNWSPLLNFALVTSSTADVITNFYYAGGTTNGIIATNQICLPGTTTTVTASSSGWSTPYLAPLPFTNSGAFTISGSSFVAVGIRVPDQPRYWQVVYTPTGTSTNWSVDATLTGQTRF